MALLRLVVLESIKQESGRRLNHTLALENINHSLDVDKSTPLVICKLSSKLRGLFR